jgi:Flp pilus assembly protein CpaB
LLAAALAALGIVVAITALRGPVATETIAVAAHDLPAGARLGASDVRLMNVPRTQAPAGVSPTAAGIVGRALVDPVRAREPLTDVRFAGSQPLAGLSPGQVAAPIRLVDPDIGPLLKPGAAVDVLATPEVADGSPASSSEPARLVVRGVRVLAVPVPSAPSGSPSQGTLAVLAVTRSDAQALAGAEASGRLSVVFEPG